MKNPNDLKVEKNLVVSEFYTVNDINIGSVIRRAGTYRAVSRFNTDCYQAFKTENECVEYLKFHFCEWYQSVNYE